MATSSAVVDRVAIAGALLAPSVQVATGVFGDEHGVVAHDIVPIAADTVLVADATAPHVRQVIDGFHMARVRASTVPTKMVQFQSCRDGVDQKFVDDAVSDAHPVHPPHAAIAGTVMVAGPFPTAARRLAESV